MSTPDPERLARETAKGIVQMFRHADAYGAPEVTEEDVYAHVLASIRSVAPQQGRNEDAERLKTELLRTMREIFDAANTLANHYSCDHVTHGLYETAGRIKAMGLDEWSRAAIDQAREGKP